MFHDPLKHEGGGVVVERDGSDEGIVFKAIQPVVDKHGLATPSPTHEHHRTPVGHEQVHKILQAGGLGCVDQYSLSG